MKCLICQFERVFIHPESHVTSSHFGESHWVLAFACSFNKTALLLKLFHLPFISESKLLDEKLFLRLREWRNFLTHIVVWLLHVMEQSNPIQWTKFLCSKNFDCLLACIDTIRVLLLLYELITWMNQFAWALTFGFESQVVWSCVEQSQQAHPI